MNLAQYIFKKKLNLTRLELKSTLYCLQFCVVYNSDKDNFPSEDEPLGHQAEHRRCREMRMRHVLKLV